VTASRTTTFPDVGIEPPLVADLELALLGVLDEHQVLGGAVPAHPASDAALDPNPGDERGHRRVRLPLPAGLVDDVVAAGGVVLRDEEWTPFARLVEAEPEVAVGETPAAGSVVVSGVLEPLKAREAGFGRSQALTAADAAAPGEPLHLVVLRRPPVGDEHQQLGDLGTQARSRVLFVVPAGPASAGEVPPAVLVEVARSLTATWQAGWSVRTAPLAWRDDVSDQHLVDRLARRLGAGDVTYLGSAATEPTSAAQWQEALRLLDEGTADDLPGLSAATQEALRRWRPPRTRRGLVLMFTGLSGSGKSTLARSVTEHIRRAGRTVSLLDGDVVRTMLSSGLGFDRASRELNIERIGYVAAEVARHGGVAVCAPIAPYERSRAAVRRMALEHGDFVLVHVSTPIEECERRDLKGLYAKARAGEIAEFTGVSDPYEVPTDADLAVDTSVLDPDDATRVVVDHLVRGGWLPGGTS
jgi:sulfate adenylyltransferase